MKRILSVLLTFALLLPATACAPKNELVEPPVSQTTQKPADSKSETIRIIALSDYAPHIQVAIDQLAESGKDYDFVIDEIPFDSLDQKINLEHQSGEGYDIILVNNSSVKQFVNMGILAPLDDYVATSPLNIEENYSDALLSVGAVNDVQYAIPFAPDCRVLAYNTNLLEQFNLEAPKTQEDIMAISKAVTGDGVYGFARRMDTPLAPAYIEGCFWKANGANILVEDGDTLTATCNTPEMLESVTWWNEMVPYMPADINMSEQQNRQMFIEGKLAFYIYGPWDIPQMGDLVYGEDYELMTTPGSVSDGATMGGWYIGIGSNGTDKEGTAALLDVFLAPENICAMQMGLPADSRGYEMEPYNDDIYKVFNEAFKSAQVVFPFTDDFNKINDIFFEHFNLVLIGGEDVTQTMNDCNDAIQQVLDEA